MLSQSIFEQVLERQLRLFGLKQDAKPWVTIYTTYITNKSTSTIGPW